MATPQVKNTMQITRGQAYKAKLVAMPTTTRILRGSDKELWGSADKQGLAIEFPAMPDTIELARSAEYVVLQSPFLPDGYHQYQGTRPLEMPVSFRLHSFDSTYCKQGALTLLQIAARLHSFVLPITNEANVMAQATKPERTAGQTEEGKLEKNSETGGVPWTTYGADSKSSANVYPPVTCWLHLIWADEGLPGISCVGYVKDVRVVLHGPFLKGPRGAFNLPSSGEFSFTFVHRPGHNNDFGASSTGKQQRIGAQTSAYATDVRDYLYNTRHLVYVASYKGLDDAVPVAETEENQEAVQSKALQDGVPIWTQAQLDAAIASQAAWRNASQAERDAVNRQIATTPVRLIPQEEQPPPGTVRTASGGWVKPGATGNFY